MHADSANYGRILQRRLRANTNLYVNAVNIIDQIMEIEQASIQGAYKLGFNREARLMSAVLPNFSNCHAHGVFIRPAR